ncbi:hypothetical protein HME9302_00975 [Alteripontixanthobacter maritimus]|uniref:Uncharacterized protein n=2 Tax=Alteripontixanthobacter maritimus TaxID=2161824 RepID=A0A369Q5S7_9SPHN|nr:hypothetical protein HME9302_00975 [Alteripontixanthobacter maritimus]
MDKPDTSYGRKVTALHGGDIVTGAPNAGCVAKLKELLERAEAGEITGIVCASLHSDKLASYSIAGMVGPYSLLGAADMAQSELLDLMKAAQGDG